MKFIKDHAIDARQFRVGLDHPCENAFCDDFYAGVWAGFALATHRVADGLADGFVQLAGKAFSGCARREAARLEHDDFAVEFRGLQHRQRDAGGFAGTGGRLQDGTPMGFKRAQERGKDVING